MSAFAVHLRRGPGLWITPATVLAGTALAFSEVQTLTVWSLSSSAVANSPYVMGAFVAGGGAWLSVQARRRGTLQADRLSARGPAAAAAVDMGALAVWALVAYGVVAAIVLVPTAFQATWGGPAWLWLVESAVGLVAFVPLGWILGRLAPFRFTPFAVAVLAFATAVFWDESPKTTWWWHRLFPALQWLLRPFDEPRALPLVGQILWYLGIGAAVLAIVAVAGREPARRTGVLVAVAGVLVAGGVGIAASTEQGRVVFADPDVHRELVCAGDDPVVCVHPAYRDALPMVRERFAPVVQRLAGTPFAVHRAEQQPRGGLAVPPKPEVTGFGLDWPTATYVDVAADDLVRSALDGTASCDLSNDDLTTGLNPYMVVETWAFGEGQVAVSPDAQALTWLNGLDEPDARAWLTAHAGEIRSCTLAYSDFS